MKVMKIRTCACASNNCQECYGVAVSWGKKFVCMCECHGNERHGAEQQMLAFVSAREVTMVRRKAQSGVITPRVHRLH